MRRAAVVLAPLAVVFVLALWRSNGPAPKPANAARDVFSATRAMATLRTILADGAPHPLGTAANTRVRERVIAQLRTLGYNVVEQQRFACNAMAICGNVRNVIARMPGASARGDVVLAVAHYDSVGAGPGASDDGMGVATLLETARAIRGEHFRNRVEFLVDDGEESGLLGAEGFVADASLLHDVGVVINVENRGTSGASNMFETSRGNRWLIRALARGLEHPNATSLFYAVYTLLPNDTDVTIFKRAEKASINFAAIGGANWYHTPFDDLAHASPRTLQHHGDNILGSLRVFANADLGTRSRTDATYFDVLQFVLLWWPAEWTLWIALASLALLIFAARKTPPRAMTFGVLAAFTAMLLAVVVGHVLGWLVRLRAEDVNWAAHPFAGVAAMWLAGIAAATAAAALFAKRSDERALLYGVAIVWHALTVLVAVVLPGASYLFLAPSIALTLCALSRASALTTGVVAATVAAIVFFPPGLLLYAALGARLIGAIAILIGVFATLVAPLFARMRVAIAFASAALVLAIVAMVTPAISRERPRTLSLLYLDDARMGSPFWITSKLTEPLQHAASFRKAGDVLTPWSYDAWIAPAPHLPLARVAMTGMRSGDRVVLHLVSARNAPRIVLLYRGGSVRSVNGVVPPPRPARFRDRGTAGWQYALVSGAPSFDIEFSANARLDVVASDSTYGLPAEGAALAHARDASPAIPIHEGDLTITRVHASY
ncbi:MAG: M28 family peptidase [Acidobacteria bacterium]|nr:M28 family peptidase [Acidobacteriota bacterium]MBV9475567.1 M28 family peptidase [Acidobacteriota bacterium]